jgi:hypothetical protein
MVRFLVLNFISTTNETIFNYTLLKISEDNHALSFRVHRFWYQWKGPNPSAQIVDFVNKNYPSDWTYADFANQFRAELYGEYV